MIEVQVSFLLAFAAGAVSVLSACVLPIVPSYLAFVSGLMLAELRQGSARDARAGALLYSTLFMVGFGLVLMTMGLVATPIGPPIARTLPWINRIGGGVMILFGLLLMGLVRLLDVREDAHGMAPSRSTRALGSLAVGVAFGAGWTPCIGPILGSVLLYTSLEATMVRGGLLLATYAVGLGVPFVAASVGLSRLLSGTGRGRAWLVPLQRVAGTVLVVVGFMMVTGRFARMTAFLAGLGQLINLEVS